MKKITKWLLFLTILFATTFIKAQIVNCSDFTILNFGPNEFNSGESLIHIRLGADSLTFVSYPYVLAVIDCNGDTIATGNLNFFGQAGQSIQSYPVTNNLSNACLPISVVFVYGNTNLETDTCLLSLNSLPPALSCGDFLPIDILVDQSNTLINISMQGTGNTYISNPRVSFVTDCSGDTIATGFFNSAGQIGLSTQGYPITPLFNMVCYPVTVEFVFGNTNFETDTCSLILNSPTAIVETLQKKESISIYPNPSSDEIIILTKPNIFGKNYLIYDSLGSVIMKGRIVSENIRLQIKHLPVGLYFFKTEDSFAEIIKIIKH